jgi:hypothetical protein
MEPKQVHIGQFLINSSDYSGNSGQIEVCSLKYSYKEFAWFFARINGQYSMTIVPRYVFYVLQHFVHEDVVFDWGHIISSEVSIQLGKFWKAKNFFMNSYLLYSISYCHIFECFPQERNVYFS